MSMLRNISGMDVDDGPHTLHSTMPSRENSSYDLSSLLSNNLQISQSPTENFLTKSYKGSGVPIENIGKRSSLSMPQDNTFQSEITSAAKQTTVLCSVQPRDENNINVLDSTNTKTSINIPDSKKNVSTDKCNASINILDSKNNVSTDKCNASINILDSKNNVSTDKCTASINIPDSKINVSTDKCNASINILDSKNVSTDRQTVTDPTSSEQSQGHCTGFTNHNTSNNSFSNPSAQISGPNISSDFKGTPNSSFSAYSEQFFSFVILHASEDQDIASRVCRDLQDRGVRPGATFGEEFETPGNSPLTCLEDAVENSAYIILLLTDAFLSKWGKFQANTVLMNSIENDTFGSIIPFYPRPKKTVGKIDLCLRTLIPLDENSPAFEQKVRRTFKPEVIEKRYQLWREKQYFRALQNSIKNAADRVRLQNEYLPNVGTEIPSVLPCQIQIPLFPGQSPVIQISNAANIQIGNQNSLHVQAMPNEPQREMDANCYFNEENIPAC